jgi:hypothetical protein
MTSKQDEQKERRALTGSTTTTTFRDMANLDLSLGGRFAVPGSKPDVSGSEEITRYPRLPPSNPWSSDLVGVEPPLGWSVEDQECCGTFEEIQRSASSVFPSLVATAPPLELTRSDSKGGGDLSRVASTIPKVDASRAGGRLHSRKVSFPSATVETPPAFSSGNISKAELDELLGRLIVKPGKERQ